VRAAVDVMGGDKAPAAVLEGCWEAAPLLDTNDLVYLIGCEQTITAGLAASKLTPDQKSLYKIIPTTQVIEMDESPVDAIRGGRSDKENDRRDKEPVACSECLFHDNHPSSRRSGCGTDGAVHSTQP